MTMRRLRALPVWTERKFVLLQNAVVPKWIYSHLVIAANRTHLGIVQQTPREVRPAAPQRLLRQTAAEPYPYLLDKGLIIEVGSANAEVDNVDPEEQCIVERIQEPRRVRHLRGAKQRE